MRNLISMVAGAAFVAALAIPAFAADMTVKGEVVDVACLTSKKDAGKGAGHANCAMVCAKKGSPVGILTADAVYTVTGEVTEKDGVKSINVKSIKLAN